MLPNSYKGWHAKQDFHPASVAQLVESNAHNARVLGSFPALANLFFQEYNDIFFDTRPEDNFLFA